MGPKPSCRGADWLRYRGSSAQAEGDDEGPPSAAETRHLIRACASTSFDQIKSFGFRAARILTRSCAALGVNVLTLGNCIVENRDEN